MCELFWELELGPEPPLSWKFIATEAAGQQFSPFGVNDPLGLQIKEQLATTTKETGKNMKSLHLEM